MIISQLLVSQFILRANYAFNFLLDNEEEKLIDLSCGIQYIFIITIKL